MASKSKPAPEKKAAAREPGAMPPMGFRVPHGIAKTIAIVVGLALTVLSLMAVIGLLSDNFWVRLVPAVLLAVAAPLIVVERLLPKNDLKKAKGLPTDFLAVVWLGFAVLFVGVAGPLTRGVLLEEGDRYAASGTTAVARAVYWVAGATPELAERSDDAPAEGGGGGGAGDDDAAPRGDGGAPAAAGDGGARADAADSPSDTDR